MSIKKIFLIFIGFTAILSLISYSFFTSIFKNDFEPRVFNSNEWKTDKNNRVELVDDLIQSKVLDSLTQTELNYLLGQPEKDPYFKENDNVVYYLGPERGLGIDSEWLVIWIKNDSVNRYEILHD